MDLEQRTQCQGGMLEFGLLRWIGCSADDGKSIAAGALHLVGRDATACPAVAGASWSLRIAETGSRKESEIN